MARKFKSFLDLTPEERMQAAAEWLLNMDPEQRHAVKAAFEEILKAAGDGDDDRTVEQVLAGKPN